MPWKTKVLWEYLPISLRTWHQVLCSLGMLSPEPLLCHGVREAPSTSLCGPTWGRARALRGHTEMSPNRSQVPHQPVQVSSYICSAHSALQRQSLGANRMGETSSSPNTGGCFVKRSFWLFFFKSRWGFFMSGFCFWLETCENHSMTFAGWKSSQNQPAPGQWSSASCNALPVPLGAELQPSPGKEFSLSSPFSPLSFCWESENTAHSSSANCSSCFKLTKVHYFTL